MSSSNDPEIVELIAFFESVCDAYVKALQTIQLLQYFPWAAFSALRTYALSGRNWEIAAVVLLLSMVPIGINFITNDSLSQVSYFTTFTEPFTAVLVSRFLLDLQEVNQYNQNSSPSTGLTQGSSLDIAWVVGSLGSSLAHGDDAEYVSSAHDTESGLDGRDGLAWDDNELRTLGVTKREGDREGIPASNLAYEPRAASIQSVT
ncbi:hypothetical protein TRAPUB_5013 [Trametes pubescens]|uniref:Uncharacterized protein n=1 Tax=Trametes pubescens TaxID=154538 RepID=A0A1M2V9P6_TRAPU|nr:hypothetical protein TRAPUB_5013 [Trametes pubescens]